GLQMMLAAALVIQRGHAAPDVEAAWERAHQLARAAGDTDLPYTALTGVAVYRLNRGELRTARELVDGLLAGRETVSDPTLLRLAHGMLMGVVLLFLGELRSSREHLEECIPLYEPERMVSLRFLFGNDPGASSMSTLAVTLAHLGHLDRALEQSRDALPFTEGLPHPFSMTYAHPHATGVHP